jgi:NAD(P)-dependent dehydrogenase (short-subunit alcohol dehydrogenase family)
MAMTIDGKAVLIRGASRGVGQALVEQALWRGPQTAYAATPRPLLHADERVLPLTLDVTDAAQIQAAVERVKSLVCDLPVRKKAPQGVADAIFHAVAEGEGVFPDPMSGTLFAARWGAGAAKQLERQNAGLVQAA